jgi:hypothetical protein
MAEELQCSVSALLATASPAPDFPDTPNYRNQWHDNRPYQHGHRQVPASNERSTAANQHTERHQQQRYPSAVPCGLKPPLGHSRTDGAERKREYSDNHGRRFHANALVCWQDRHTANARENDLSATP